MIFNKFFENVAISNIREPHEQIQVAYMKKLKSFVNSGVLATCILWLRLFFPPVCYLKTSKFEVHKIIILPAVLYWYKIWLFTVWDEHGLRVLKRSALKTVFGSNRDEITRGWRGSHIEGPCDLNFSPLFGWTTKEDELSGTCDRYSGEEKYTGSCDWKNWRRETASKAYELTEG